VNLKAQKTEIR
jgi:SMC interacting uncharacterized protein involved in chromosome segregation